MSTLVSSVMFMTRIVFRWRRGERTGRQIDLGQADCPRGVDGEPFFVAE